MLNQNPKITAAGLALVTAAAATPGKSVAITEVAIGSQSYTPSGTETALKQEIARFPVSGGAVPSGSQVQIGFTITNTDPQNRSSSSQWVGEVGFYAGDTLFALLSKPEPAFFYKSQDINIPIVYALDVSALPAGSVTVNSTADPAALSSLISQHEANVAAHAGMLATQANASQKKGATEQRPADRFMGMYFFDTTLGKPVWWNGAAWTDANGMSV